MDLELKNQRNGTDNVTVTIRIRYLGEEQNALTTLMRWEDPCLREMRISSYVQIMDGLMGQPLTTYQNPIFKWAVQHAIGFPNASLETLIKILTPTPEGQPTGYDEVFHLLEPAVQRYLSRSYETYGRITSREQIVSRLESLNADPL